MELVLPNNYVEIEEEEMMYLDGGWQFTGLYTWVISAGINGAFGWAFGAGGAVGALIAKLGKNSLKSYIRRYLTKWLTYQAANRMTGIIGGYLNGKASLSIGGFVAWVWDRNDTNPGNGICGSFR